jgi:hypothetical protein
VLPDRTTLGRAAAAIAATLLLSLLFIGSYVGALHDPRPTDVPVAVAAQVPDEVAAALGRGGAIEVRRVADAEQARRAIERRDAYGALVAGRRGLELVTAPAASVAVAQLLRAELPPQLRQAGATVRTTEVHALPTGDPRGLVSFYLAIGLVLAGYLGAALLGLALGTELGLRQTGRRLLAIGVLAVLGGLLGTAVASAIGGGGAFGLCALAGALTVAAVGAATVAFQRLLGFVGTGVSILLFVILGNPAAGGAAPPELLPEPWRAVGQLLPNGAATTAIHDARYFPDASLAGPLLVLVAWTAVAVAVALLLGRRGRALSPEQEQAAAAAAAGV